MTSEHDLTEFHTPLFSVNNVLFTMLQDSLKVLLVKRTSAPFKGRWELPGECVDIELDDNTDMSALRNIKALTAATPQFFEQLQAFSGINRDPRGFSVSLVYYALISPQCIAVKPSAVEEVKWMDLSAIQDLAIAFDHKQIIATARSQLQQKALYSMIPVYCLADQFTIGQLKAAIEAIIAKPIQRKSLIRRVEASGMLEALDEKVKSGGRLAQLYRLKSDTETVYFERSLSFG
ncbi:NUDIX hydrolase [Pseudoalteromonas sp. SCSIO 43201]|nr:MULTISPECIES: NUDIX domain-containing protein [Pseudoalteromonas]MDW7551228.1 NUDIX domain-containing protein [Pseudoalteromonas peptidolytica]NLR14451.1 NUDIX hydrolase [Pseudoalteromonas peptidolytica]USD28413.1 NUDIX hydrolase [Pseudoalteromonas sp. SCSIO 43201]GEK08139.1 NUDIX hydrolase [Pseudoalteromonas peptidolytica]